MIRQGRLEWRAEVAAADMVQITPGTARHRARRPAARRSPAPCAWSRRRSIRRPATASSTSTCRRPGSARAGMFARGEFEIGSSSALTVPQSAVVLREGFSYVFRVGADNKVTQAKVEVGRRARRPHRDGRRPRARRARRRHGRRLPRRGRHRSRRRCAGGHERGRFVARAARRRSGHDQRLGLVDPQPDPRRCCSSSCSPPSGLMSFKAMKVQNFPDIDLPTVTVTASLPGASPSQLETDVARKIENQIATLQGVKHIYTSVQDGVSTTTVEFRLEKPTQEAVDDVRDAVSRVRSDLPAELRDPIISKFDLAGSPILTYTVASSRMDDEALSLVRRRHGDAQRCWRCAAWARSRASAARRARSASSSTRRACSRSTPPPPTSRASCARRSAKSSGGRADVGGAEQSVRTIATVQSAAELAQMEIALSDGRRIRLDQVAQRQRHRRRAALGGLPERPAGGRLRDRAHARRRRGRRRARRARRAREAEDGQPRHRDHRGVQLRRSGRAELRRLDGAAVRRRRARRAGGVPVPARLARHAGRRRRRCRCRSSRPSRRCRCSASRSTA